MVWPLGNTYEERVRFYIVAIVLFVILFPIIPALFAYEGRQLLWNAHFARDLALLGVVVGALVLLALRRAHAHQWAELTRELVFIFWHGKYACLLGGALGLIAASIYLILPFDKNNDEFAERAASAFAIYIGTVGSVLGIHTLYRKSAPITDVELFLESLCNDLDEYGRLGNQLLIIYPALNIGFYRTIKQFKYGSADSIPDSHPYSRFSDRLIRTARRLKGRARVITYPKSQYRGLFEAYDRGESNPQMVSLCTDEAINFANVFAAAAGEGSHIEVHPHNSPPQVIVIGPVSYSILSYGLPRFREDEDGQRFDANEDGVATLLVYRREDSALAALILREIEEEIKSFNREVKNRDVSSDRGATSTTLPSPAT